MNIALERANQRLAVAKQRHKAAVESQKHITTVAARQTEEAYQEVRAAANEIAQIAEDMRKAGLPLDG